MEPSTQHVSEQFLTIFLLGVGLLKIMWTLNIFMIIVPNARDAPRAKNHNRATHRPSITDLLRVGIANRTIAR